MKKMNIIIDVGANEGSFLRQYLDDEKNMIFAFEPVPHLYEKLKSLELNHKNIKVFNYAINNNDGIEDFYINEPHYTSSLKPFTKYKDDWDEKVLLHQVNVINVKVYKLSTFLIENDLLGKVISFLKIDTQGSDLDVVKSLGNNIQNIKEIQLECFLTKNEESLYENEGKCDEILNFFESNNFTLKHHLKEDEKWSNLIFENKQFLI